VHLLVGTWPHTGLPSVLAAASLHAAHPSAQHANRKHIEITRGSSPLIRRWSAAPIGIVADALSGAYGGCLTVARCDTGCRSDVEALLWPEKGQPPVHGIVNSGGVLADAVIPKQTAAGVRCHCPLFAATVPLALALSTVQCPEQRVDLVTFTLVVIHAP
jgi:hypothetical protein